MLFRYFFSQYSFCVWKEAAGRLSAVMTKAILLGVSDMTLGLKKEACMVT